jgi:hypothetical protein
MTGAEWLERVFEPGLRVGDPAAQHALLGGLHALRACGAIPADVARAAEGRLHERFDRPLREPPGIAAAGTRAAPGHDLLQAAFAPARALVDADGLTVVLVSVELWTSGVFVRLAGLRSGVTDELDTQYDVSMTQWHERQPAARAAGLRPPSPSQPGERLAHLPLWIADDVGTRYDRHGTSAGGTGTEWRAEWRFAPGVPRDATRLTVAVEPDDGAAHAVDLALAGSRPV